MKYIAIDFEFRENIETKGYHIICACLYNETISKKFWLENDSRSQEMFKEYIYNLANQNYVFIAHFANAEITSLLSLGLNTDTLKFIDTYIEYRLLQNDDNKANRKILSLSDICLKYNIYNYFKDNYKDKMRDLCLTGKVYTTKDKEDILEYCLIDCINGFKIARIAIQEYQRIFGKTYSVDNAIKRADVVKGFGLASYNIGLPLDMDFVNKVRDNYQLVFDSFIENSHEDVRYCFERSGVSFIFKANKLEEMILKHGLQQKWSTTETGKFSTKTDELKKMRHYHEFIESLYTTIKNTKALSYHRPNDMKDRAKELKLAYSISQDLQLEAFKLVLDSDCLTLVNSNLKLDKDYINSVLGTKYTRVEDLYTYVCKNNAKIKQSMEVFEAYKVVKKDILNKIDEDSTILNTEETFFNSIKEGTINMYYSPYGTISARNAPRSKTFLFAQPAWSRSMLKVPKGHKLVSLDFSGAEIFLAALITKDNNLLESYHSKDFYLQSGVLMGVIPSSDFENLKVSELKEKYKQERNMLKILILSKQYGAGVAAIAKSLFPTDSENLAISKTRKLVAKYERVYRNFFKDTAIFKKTATGTSLLKWHWGFNNPQKQLTVGNWRIQTSNAMALHECVIKLSTHKMISKGLSFVTSLHDAILVAIKDDDKFDLRLDYIIKTMKDSCDIVTGNTGKQIKVSYSVFESESNFVEKGEEQPKNIAKLVGHDLDFRYGDEIEV